MISQRLPAPRPNSGRPAGLRPRGSGLEHGSADRMYAGIARISLVLKEVSARSQLGELTGADVSETLFATGVDIALVGWPLHNDGRSPRGGKVGGSERGEGDHVLGYLRSLRPRATAFRIDHLHLSQARLTDSSHRGDLGEQIEHLADGGVNPQGPRVHAQNDQPAGSSEFPAQGL